MPLVVRAGEVRARVPDALYEVGGVAVGRRGKRAMKRRLVIIGALACLGGCRAYHPAPVDVGAFERDYASRAERIEVGGGIDRARAEGLALVFHPDLRAARARAGIERVNALHAGLWTDPMLGLDLMRMLEGGAAWEAMLSAEVTLPVSGRLGALKRTADARHALELQRVEAMEWEKRMEVRKAWAAWEASEERARALDDALGDLAALVGILEGRERAGEGKRLETDLYRLAYSIARSERAREALMCDEARLGVLRAMGMPPEAGIELKPGGWMSERTLGGFEGHPSLRVALAEHRVAEEELAYEVRMQYPDIEVGAGAGRQDGGRRVRLGVALPVPVFNANRGGIARAEAVRHAAAEAVSGAWEALAGEWALARVRAERARERARIVEEEVKPLAERRRRDAVEVARTGEVDPAMLLETIEGLREAAIEAAGARLELRSALVRLEELVGPGEESP